MVARIIAEQTKRTPRERSNTEMVTKAARRREKFQKDEEAGWISNDTSSIKCDNNNLVTSIKGLSRIRACRPPVCICRLLSGKFDLNLLLPDPFGCYLCKCSLMLDSISVAVN